jgi:hypothetical protein
MWRIIVVVFAVLAGCADRGEPPTPTIVVQAPSDEAKIVSESKIVIDERQATPLCFYVNSQARVMAHIPCDAIRRSSNREIVAHDVLAAPKEKPKPDARPVPPNVVEAMPDGGK